MKLGIAIVALISSIIKLSQQTGVTINKKVFNFYDQSQVATFPTKVHNERGMYLYQSIARVDYETFDTSLYMNLNTYSISGWFYSCDQGDFQLLSRQSQVSPFKEYLGIRLDGYGQYHITLSLQKGMVQKSIQSGLYTESGWNYFALSIERTVDTTQSTTRYFNTLNLTIGHNSFPIQDINGLKGRLKTYSETWQRQTVVIAAVTYAASSQDCIEATTDLVFGSRHFAPGNLYSGFMHGFIHSLRIYDTAVAISVLQQNDFTNDCDGECDICPRYDAKCHIGQSKERFTVKIDFSASETTIADLSGNANQLTLQPNLYPPIFIPYQGLLFGQNKLAARPTGDTTSFTIENKQVFCIETWFKLIQSNNQEGIIFGKYDAVNMEYKLSLKISENQIRVRYLNNFYDKQYIFGDEKWHFLQVCFRSSDMTQDTQMLLWIDDLSADIQQFEDSYVDNSLYEVHIGKDFPGLLKSLSLSHNVDWDCTSEYKQSSHITNICSPSQNNNTCQFCSAIQYGHMAQPSQCFSNCSLTTYDQKCTKCDFRCKYCTGGLQIECTECGESAYMSSSGLCECAPGYYTDWNKKECAKCNEACALCADDSNRCLACAPGTYRVYERQCVKTCPIGYIGDSMSGLCVYDRRKVAAPDAARNCTQHQFYNIYNQTCQECHPSCETCYGFYEDDCYTCYRGTYLWISPTSTYDRACVACHPTGMYYGPSGECLEKCGDGKNYNINQCDDGNLENGDGCSSECEIEPEWKCSNGSAVSKDICYPVRAEIYDIVLTDWNHLLVEFTRDITLTGELTKKNFEVYLYTNTLINETSARVLQSELQIQVNFTKVNWILPETTYSLSPTKLLFFQLNQTQLQTYYQNADLSQNYTKLYLGAKYLSTKRQPLRDLRNIEIHDNTSMNISFTYQKPDLSSYLPEDGFQVIESSQVKSRDKFLKLGQLSAELFIIGIIMNLFGYLVTNKSCMPTVYLILTLQTYHMLIIPGDAKLFKNSLWKFLSSYDFTQFEFKFIPNFLFGEMIDEYIPQRGIYGPTLEYMGFYYNAVMINIFRKLLLVFIYFCFLLPLAIFAKLIFGQDSDVIKIWPDKYLFSGTTILFFLLCQPLCLAAFAELKAYHALTNVTDYEFASYCLSWLILAVVIVSIINSFVLVIRHYRISDHPLIQLRFNSLFTAYKQHSLKSLITMPLIMLVTVAKVYVLIWVKQYHYQVCCGLSGMMLLYLLIVRPFRFKSNNYASILLELYMVLQCVFFLLNQVKGTNIDMLSAVITLMASIIFVISMASDTVISLLQWKKAKDQMQLHPFHLVPTDISKEVLKNSLKKVTKILETEEQSLKQSEPVAVLTESQKQTTESQQQQDDNVLDFIKPETTLEARYSKALKPQIENDFEEVKVLKEKKTSKISKRSKKQ